MNAISRIINDPQNYGGLKVVDIANVVSISPATLSDWMSGKTSPHQKTQLTISDLRSVVDRLSVFYAPDEIRIWLHSTHRLLNGEHAIDLINQGHADHVLAIIESLDEGSFT